MGFGKPQTIFMSHIYMKFDFGEDEEKAQAACHKLDGWRQAFRLDKRVQFRKGLTLRKNGATSD